MHFDDRLATVLRQSVAGETIARIQFRQLLDLLGTSPSEAQTPQIDAAYMRLGTLSKQIAPSRRSAMLGEPVLRLRNPRLVAELAGAEQVVAAAALATAQLTEAQWLDLIPALPIHARSHVRQRKDLTPRTVALLDRLGIGRPALPLTQQAENPASQIVQPTSGESPAVVCDPPVSTNEMPDAGTVSPVPEATAPIEGTSPDAYAPPRKGSEHGEAISAIVRRIEEFRAARKLEEEEKQYAAADLQAPRLPLGDLTDQAEACPASFDFMTDRDNRIVWCDRALAPMVIGLRLSTGERDAPVTGSRTLARAVAMRLPVRGEAIRIDGAKPIAGEWQVDAAPRFDRPDGAFAGYLGRLRRPVVIESADSAAPARPSEAERMRQILHELRTPVSAIQGFAEVIQQELIVPTPHEYRALAAGIVSDAARILAGFGELDRIAKLATGAAEIEPGLCDMGAIVMATVSHLSAYGEPRGSGFALASSDSDDPPVAAVAPEDAELLTWRFLAALAGATSPGERLKLRLKTMSGKVRLTVRLPGRLNERDDESLFHATVGAQSQALSASMFGTGFALRLAREEARSAGGDLRRSGKKLHLELPAASPHHEVKGAVTEIGQKPEATG